MAIKVLHFIVNSHIRGAERQLINLLSDPAPQIEHSLLTAYAPGLLNKTIRKLGLQADSLNISNNWPLALMRLIKYLRQHRPDILHVYGLKADLIARPAAKLAGVPMLFSAVRSVYTNRSSLAFLLDKLSAGAVTLFVSNSKTGAEFYQNKLQLQPDKFEVIYNGIDTDELKPYPRNQQFRQKWQIPWSAPLLTNVAELNPDKGQELLIRIMPTIWQTHPTAVLCLVGQDTQKGRYQLLAKKLGVAKRVVFVGFVENIKEVLNETDIFLFPSRWEGLPTAVLEAMSMALPIIAAAVGGLPELITNQEQGYLLAPQAADMWIKTINSFLDDEAPRVRLGAQARAKAISNFSIQALRHNLSALYQHYYQKYDQEKIT